MAKNKKKVKLKYVNVALLLAMAGIGSFLVFNKMDPRDKINIEQVISEVKEMHPNVDYEYTSDTLNYYVVTDGDKQDTITVDLETGLVGNFKDLIKTNKVNAFDKKELELLETKYPDFIVSSIKNNTGGSKSYAALEDKLLISYNDYTYTYEMKEPINLNVDYDVIKDYLKIDVKTDGVEDIEDGYKYSSDKKAIALTIDDGPSGEFNAKFLDVMARNKTHATFFMQGKNMLNNPECVTNTLAAGHEIGSHTYNHINMKTNSNEAVLNSVNETKRVFKEITGEDIKLLRPPYGSFNANTLSLLDTPAILWNLDTEDWKSLDKDKVVQYTKDTVSDGSILLIHELYGSTYEALEEVLPWLYSEGYQVVSVSELAEMKGKTLEAHKAYYSFRY